MRKPIVHRLLRTSDAAQFPCRHRCRLTSFTSPLHAAPASLPARTVATRANFPPCNGVTHPAFYDCPAAPAPTLSAPTTQCSKTPKRCMCGSEG